MSAIKYVAEVQARSKQLKHSRDQGQKLLPEAEKRPFPLKTAPHALGRVLHIDPLRSDILSFRIYVARSQNDCTNSLSLGYPRPIWSDDAT